VRADLPILLNLRCTTEHLGGQSWIDVTNAPVATSSAAQGGGD
jgi:hypothetical protein